MLTVTKEFHFEYGHSLPNYDGPCCRLHGHSGKLFVEVAGGIETKTENKYPGMVIDFSTLKRIVEEEVISKLDHMYLNDLMEFPTAENITLWIVEQLQPFLVKSSSEYEFMKQQPAMRNGKRNENI
jgi:6-pyruvoyltetrahydropterin/6-carboxytetrahydropterin synthase